MQLKIDAADEIGAALMVQHGGAVPLNDDDDDVDKEVEDGDEDDDEASRRSSSSSISFPSALLHLRHP